MEILEEQHNLHREATGFVVMTCYIACNYFFMFP